MKAELAYYAIYVRATKIIAEGAQLTCYSPRSCTTSERRSTLVCRRPRDRSRILGVQRLADWVCILRCGC